MTAVTTTAVDTSANNAPRPCPWSGPLDLATVSAAVKLFHGDIKDSVIELRAIAPGRGIDVLDGYFDHGDLRYLHKEVGIWDGKRQLYVGVQPRPKRLHSRARNHMALRVEGAKAQDIEDVTCLIIDIDPVRPKDTASTEEQLALAMAVAERIRNDFFMMNWTPPVRAGSGNGVHVIFAFPPVHIKDDAHRAEVAIKLRSFEAWIRAKYTVAGIKIDTISDLPRIIKLTGVLSIKGDNTPEHPWRRSYFIDPPVRVENPLFWKFVFRVNGTWGFIHSNNNEGLAIAQRYRSGGITDVRGFYPYSLGPRLSISSTFDPNAAPVSTGINIGGNMRVTINTEIEFPIVEVVGIKGVVFFDAGNSFNFEDSWCQAGSGRGINKFTDPCNHNPLYLRTSTGFGFRWFSPMGPLRFEWGWPTTTYPGEDNFMFEFTFGNFF